MNPFDLFYLRTTYDSLYNNIFVSSEPFCCEHTVFLEIIFRVSEYLDSYILGSVFFTILSPLSLVYQ